jgi:tripartite-type tricarboxylate transporter receptor subunit TctC
MRKKIVFMVSLLVIFGLVTSVFGQKKPDFPRKSVTVICPWSPGGGTDVLLRSLSKETEKFLGQSITVVNNTGGGGGIGHAAIMNANPDGYTVGMITFELNSLPPQGLIPFTYKDYDPLMRINADPPALTVKKDSPFNNVKDFVTYAKAHPDEIAIGNSGPGSVWHIAAGLMAQKTGIKVKYVPFDGAAPAVTSLVGGHIQAVSVSAAEVRAQVEAGNLKILGIMDTKREALFPNVPTFKEQGVDVTFYTWRGLALPKKVDPAVHAILSDAFKKAFDSKDFQDFAKKVGLNLAYQDGKDFAKFLETNAKDVEAVMKTLGLTKK